jgi:hypothetical protein
MLRILLPGLLRMLLISITTLAQAEPVYRWIDRAGVTHFSETPPDRTVTGVRIVDLPPPGPEQPVQADDYYSVANQAARMEARRLESERLRAEQQRAAAALRQTEAASVAPPQEPEPEPVYQYLYFPYPPHPAGPYFRPGRHRPRTGPPPGADRGHRQPRSGWPNYSFPDTPLRRQ